jgi:hypothetical protein
LGCVHCVALVHGRAWPTACCVQAEEAARVEAARLKAEEEAKAAAAAKKKPAGATPVKPGAKGKSPRLAETPVPAPPEPSDREKVDLARRAFKVRPGRRLRVVSPRTGLVYFPLCVCLAAPALVPLTDLSSSTFATSVDVLIARCLLCALDCRACCLRACAGFAVSSSSLSGRGAARAGGAGG